MPSYRPNSGNGGWFPQRLALLFLFGWALSLRASDPAGPTEYQIKAAFIYNFAKFVEWPAETFRAPDKPIILGVLGDEALGQDLAVIDGKVVGTHPIRVRRFRYLPEIPECQILFILPSQRMELPAIIQAVRARNILTICEGAKDFARAGTIINLIKTADDKIRFEINVDAAKRAALKIESPLLNLAKIVHDPKSPH